MKPSFLASSSLAVVACLAIHAQAEKAPLSLDKLRESDLIVVGTVRQIRIETEPSPFERGPGNYDWGIYVTLTIEQVEKGQLTESDIEFRCFRIKMRRSRWEYLTPSGHRPIPGTGSRVRAYLNRASAGWDAALPNGITRPDANDDASVWARGQIPEAIQVSRLKSRRFTYLLPVESWFSVLVVLVALTLMAAALRHRARRRRGTTAN